MAENSPLANPKNLASDYAVKEVLLLCMRLPRDVMLVLDKPRFADE
jgi:hypothetical protein